MSHACLETTANYAHTLGAEEQGIAAVCSRERRTDRLPLPIVPRLPL
jgi:hypothetical protein